MEKIRWSYLSTLAPTIAVAIFFAWWLLKNKKPRPPTEWRQVGELSGMLVYPVKSFGPIRESSMECTQLGLKSGWLRDRTLMVTDLDGKFITARQMPKMTQITPNIIGSVLTLSATGMSMINVDLAHVGESTQVVIWGQSVPSCDCGEEIAQWLSQFLLQEKSGVRLVYYPLDGPYGDVRDNNGFPSLQKMDIGAFPDVSSYMMMNEASIGDLNNRIEDQVTPLQFRPNFIVKGAEPLEEDTWDWVRIGSVIFRNVKPCTRCIFTTIDPDTGVKHPQNEPLKTLRTYRQLEDPVLRKKARYSPVMGIHLGLKGPNGVVTVGDPVFVGIDSGRK